MRTPATVRRPAGAADGPDVLDADGPTRAAAMALARAPLRALDRRHACAIVEHGPFVLRRPLDVHHRLRFADEIALLRALPHDDLTAAVPRLAWHHDDPPVMAYRRIPGRTAAATHYRYAPEAPPAPALLHACGRFLGRLRRVTAGSSLLARVPPIEHGLRHYLAQRLAAAALPLDLRSFAIGSLARWTAFSGRALPPGLVHNDFNWRNLLVDDAGDLVGVVDWSVHGLADPHLDLGFLARWGPESFAPVAEGFRAESGHALDPRAADAAVRLNKLAALLHAAPEHRAAAIAAVRDHRPLA